MMVKFQIGTFVDTSILASQFANVTILKSEPRALQDNL